MFCTNCGKEIPDGSRFCINCGAPAGQASGNNQQPNADQGFGNNGSWSSYQNPTYGGPQNGYDRSGMNQPVQNQGELFGTILKCASFAMALLWLVFGVKLLFGSIGSVFSVLTRWGWYYGRPFFGLMNGVMGFLLAIVYIVLAVSLAAIGLSKRKDLAQSQFLLVAGSGVLLIVLAGLKSIVFALAYYGFSSKLLLPILWCLLTVAAMYVFMMVAGLQPFPTDIRAAAQGISEVLTDVMQGASKVKNSAGSVASAGANSFRQNQQAAMNEYNQRRQMQGQNNGPQAQNNGFQAQNNGFQAQNNGFQAQNNGFQAQNNGFQNQNNNFQNLGPAPSVNGVRLDERRGLLKYILMNFITCGIYSFFFIYHLAEDVNIACQGDGEDDIGGLGAYIGYTFLTCGVYAIVWEYALVNRMKANASRYGATVTYNGLTHLLWCKLGVLLCGLGPFFAMYNMCNSANILCAAYNRANGL